MGRLGRAARVAAVIGGAAALVLAVRPKDPQFELLSINLTGFRLRFEPPSLLPLLDIGLVLTVHATNPNVVGVRYSRSTMAIFYRGSLLGEAHVCAGEQRRNACRILHLPGKLNGLEMAHQLAALASDLARREMELAAETRIKGWANLLGWAHRFRIDVHSRLKVDPLLLDIMEQENRSRLQLMLCS
ncbi:hypothetical protein EJ110_NYTH41889 [Nymphaea thermarum]|nr:hypothetical protein EJ110_NYTH41889 [Nymphaea thermarum]